MTVTAPRRPRRRPSLLIVAAIAGVLLTSSYISRARVLMAVGSVLMVETVGPPADFIVPLGGGAHTRPFVAADLYRKKVAPSILLFRHAETEPIRTGIVLSETEIYRRVLELEGVPPSAIRIIPGDVNSTWGEAQAIRSSLPPGQPVTVVVVTSPEHSRRALWAFRRALAGTPTTVLMAPARHLRFDESNWWRDDEGVVLYLHEYLKLPSYWFRYRLWTGGLRPPDPLTPSLAGAPPAPLRSGGRARGAPKLPGREC